MHLLAKAAKAHPRGWRVFGEGAGLQCVLDVIALNPTEGAVLDLAAAFAASPTRPVLDVLRPIGTPGIVEPLLAVFESADFDRWELWADVAEYLAQRGISNPPAALVQAFEAPPTRLAEDEFVESRQRIGRTLCIRIAAAESLAHLSDLRGLDFIRGESQGGEPLIQFWTIPHDRGDINPGSKTDDRPGVTVAANAALARLGVAADPRGSA